MAVTYKPQSQRYHHQLFVFGSHASVSFLFVDVIANVIPNRLSAMLIQVALANFTNAFHHRVH
jgi:hypothetical protein